MNLGAHVSEAPEEQAFNNTIDDSFAGESVLMPKYMNFPYSNLTMSSSEESLPTLSPNRRVPKRKGKMTNLVFYIK